MLFWLIKMMSTTVGETGADLLNTELHFGLAGTSLVVGLCFAVALLGQLRAARYLPWRYWTAVVFVSVFGTLLTDNLSDKLGVPLALSTSCFGAALALTFILWHSKEKTLSIRAIDTPRRELFYWLAILLTFALGTAAGDWIAEGLGLGYARSALLFGGLITATALARYVCKANAVACFWVAYVLTRPFGASCGDLLSQPAGAGGFGLGTLGTSILFLVAIAGMVVYLSRAASDASEQRA
nr:hypothetical protein [Janthinobacterium sp.]